MTPLVCSPAHYLEEWLCNRIDLARNRWEAWEPLAWREPWSTRASPSPSKGRMLQRALVVEPLEASWIEIAADNWWQPSYTLEPNCKQRPCPCANAGDIAGVGGSSQSIWGRDAPPRQIEAACLGNFCPVVENGSQKGVKDTGELTKMVDTDVPSCMGFWERTCKQKEGRSLLKVACTLDFLGSCFALHGQKCSWDWQMLGWPGTYALQDWKPDSWRQGPMLGCVPHSAPAFGTLPCSIARHMDPGLLPAFHPESSTWRLRAHGCMSWEVPHQGTSPTWPSGVIWLHTPDPERELLWNNGNSKTHKCIPQRWWRPFCMAGWSSKEGQISNNGELLGVALVCKYCGSKGGSISCRKEGLRTRMLSATSDWDPS